MSLADWMSGDSPLDKFLRASGEITEFARSLRVRRLLTCIGVLAECAAAAGLAAWLLSLAADTSGQKLLWFAVFFVAAVQIELHVGNKRKLREHQYFLTIASAHIDTLRGITNELTPFDKAYEEHLRQHPLLRGATLESIYDYLAAENYRLENGGLPKLQPVPPMSTKRFASLLARLGFGAILTWVQIFESHPAFCFSGECVGFNAAWLAILVGGVYLLLSGVRMLLPRFTPPETAATARHQE